MCSSNKKQLWNRQTSLGACTIKGLGFIAKLLWFSIVAVFCAVHSKHEFFALELDLFVDYASKVVLARPNDARHIS